jgi:hypothetical protein
MPDLLNSRARFIDRQHFTIATLTEYRHYADLKSHRHVPYLTLSKTPAFASGHSACADDYDFFRAIRKMPARMGADRFDGR